MIDVACIGGGPGSDFLGIIKYLIINDKKSTVTFNICDKEKTWLNYWSNVGTKIDPMFRIFTSYFPLDVTKDEDWKSYTKYHKSDLFTMIYFMSEVLALRDSADEYFANLFEKAKPNSLFLFVDNNNPKFYAWFDQLANMHGIEVIDSNEDEIKLPFDEEKRDLGEYYKKFSYPNTNSP